MPPCVVPWPRYRPTAGSASPRAPVVSVGIFQPRETNQTTFTTSSWTHALDLGFELHHSLFVTLSLALDLLFRSAEARLVLLHPRFPLGVCRSSLLVHGRHLLLCSGELVLRIGQATLRIVRADHQCLDFIRVAGRRPLQYSQLRSQVRQRCLQSQVRKEKIPEPHAVKTTLPWPHLVRPPSR